MHLRACFLCFYSAAHSQRQSKALRWTVPGKVQSEMPFSVTCPIFHQCPCPSADTRDIASQALVHQGWPTRKRKTVVWSYCLLLCQDPWTFHFGSWFWVWLHFLNKTTMSVVLRVTCPWWLPDFLLKILFSIITWVIISSWNNVVENAPFGSHHG